ncbi:MAG TPA: alanine racemase [Xanthobacteraceae bacterium]|jgi:alanine racemase|nr:alanine racemase [Xanthobacteraceae bacterium]
MARAKRPSPAKSVPSVAETGGTLSIDLAAIVANWQTLARQLITVECAAVVKANAYGLGLKPVVTALARAGCKTFFVADVAEARTVRASARAATIYVLHGFTLECADRFVELDARPVINSMTELAEWDTFAAARGLQSGAALHVDTGMNRLGVSLAEAVALAPRAQTQNHGISLLLSHLACADIAEHPLNARQLQLFRELRTLYSGVPASLANSSGIFLGDTMHFDLARPGAALYGVNPTPGRPNPMKSVVDLTGRIVQIRNVARDQTIGYGATWTARRNCRIAVVALGYADGLLRAGSASDEHPGGSAIVAGKKCPIVGRISMDLITLDISDIADSAVRRGDFATLIGGELSIDEVAAAAGTIGYEILTRLGPRCHLIYQGG